MKKSTRSPGKTFLVVSIAIISIIVTLSGIAWYTMNLRNFQLFGKLVHHVQTDQKVVALTFDDGPIPEPTDTILEILKRKEVKATFFVTGSELEQNPEAGKKLVEAGHELGNHTYSHQHMVFKTPAFIQEEIEKTDKLIREAGYQGTIYFRPPYGKKLILLPFYLNQHNRCTIMWDIEPESQAEIGASAKNIVTYTTENVQPGSIILLHIMYKSRSESLKAVEGLIDSLQAQGYTFKTIAELLSYSQ